MKVCMIFTEGPHDVAFVRKVLKIFLNAEEKTKIKISDFPKPLDSIFEGYVKNREMQDLSLDMVQKFFLPDRIFERENYFIMLFYTGGKDNIEHVKSFISEFNFTLKYKPDVKLGFDGVNYLFINDADEDNYVDVIKNMKEMYFPIVDDDTGDKYLTEEDVNFYVWHGENGKGTLENILIGLLKSSNERLFSESETYVKNNFENLKSPENVSVQAKQYKAILTCAGQGKSSGASLNSILVRDNFDLIKVDVFKNSEFVKSFADFLISVLN